MDLVSIVIFLGIVQGVFLGTLLIFIKSPNRRANRVLGVLYICFSLSILHFLLLRNDLYEVYPHLLRVSLPPLFLFGPLYSLYVRILTDRSTRLRVVELFHAIPFLVTLALNVPFYVLPPGDKIMYFRQLVSGEHLALNLLVASTQLVHIFAYVIVVRRRLRAYDRQIRETRSSIERINLRWLTMGTQLFIGIFGLILVLVILRLAGLDTIPIYETVIPLTVSLTIYALGYLGLKQPEIFSPTEESTAARKYERSTLTPEKAAEYSGSLIEHMMTRRPFLDSNLTLPVLSEQTGIPPHHISQVLNERLQVNFFDFVNGYRVEEAKRLFQDRTKAAYSIFAIATEAGFNSKSAFNTAFKKHTGQTPTEFRMKA